MKSISRVLLLGLLTLSLHQLTTAYKEISGLLDNAKELTPEEVSALRPLFNDLQWQYDYITSEAAQHDEKTKDAAFAALYDATRKEFEDYFQALIHPKPAGDIYESHLPSAAELIGFKPTAEMSQQELNEFSDMQALLQDAIDESQLKINTLVQRALQLEANLIKINKPKIVEFVLAALGVLFQQASRVSRAAYCVYSQIPELNETLHNINDGVDCYTHTTGLVLRIQHETVATIGTIKRNVFDLAEVYKKAAAKNSLLGKLATLLLNSLRILGDVRETYGVTMKSLDRLQHDMPDAARETILCANSFVQTIPHMVKTASNVTTCILFVDDTTQDYDFMKPEAERDFDFKQQSQAVEDFDFNLED